MAADVEPAASGEASRTRRRGGTDGSDIAALLALMLLGGTWTWWALEFGAYFGAVLYPGAALLAIGLAVLLWAAPWRASLALSPPARLALWSLVALAAWSLASVLWSPTPDIAVADAQRILTYALAFGLGIWMCALLGRRMELALLPLTLAAAIAGVTTVVMLLTGSDAPGLLDEDGTLEYPLGYRNANAAFFLVALWPALGLASSGRMPRALRVGAFVTATLCVEIALLSQSRGSIPAALIALVVFVLAASRRVHAFGWLVLAILPALVCLPVSNELFDAAKANPSLVGLGDEMSSAGSTALIGAAIALGLALVAMRLEPAMRQPAWATRARIRGALVAGLIALAVAVIGLVGNPIAWAGDKADEFLAGEPDLSQESNRFSLNAGSGRSEIWRVALEAAADDPLFGEGGGGFQFRFNRERDDPNQLARDAHSVWLEMLSELGVVGAGLFLAAMVGAFAGAIRARRLGPAAAQLSCAALAAAAYWLTHASIDWFWPYPAVTAPTLALLGASVAPTLLMPGRERSSRLPRLTLFVASLAFVVSTIPPFLSERLVERAFDSFRADAQQAYDDLALARDLNPLADAPALAEGAIAQELGEQRACHRCLSGGDSKAT